MTPESTNVKFPALCVDGLAFLLDVAATLAAFMDVYPPATLPLTAEGSPVLATLASIHCQLLPAVVEGLTGYRGEAATTSAAHQVRICGLVPFAAPKLP